MKLAKIMATGALRVPWPTLVNGVDFVKGDLPEAATCQKKCALHRLCSDVIAPGEHVCVNKMSFFVASVGPDRVTVYGLRGEGNDNPPNRYNKNELKGRWLSRENYDAWVLSVNRLINEIDSDFLSRQSEMLDPLHDPIRLAKQINTIANKLVQKNSTGESLERKIDNATVELKTLVKAAGLLSDSFDLVAIYFNPDSAAFGRQTAVSLHGLVAKLIAIFRVDDGGVTRASARIYLSGSCFRSAFVYESFKLIPFAFLSNAVKYAGDGSIEVVVDDRRQFIHFSVASPGPLIEEDEKEKIFEKGFRGRWASCISGGSGVGLYLAKTIADAHGLDIHVSSIPSGKFVNGAPMARNNFHLDIPISQK